MQRIAEYTKRLEQETEKIIVGKRRQIDMILMTIFSGGHVLLNDLPGSGKTTRIPPALLDEPWLAGLKIVMLEPRRIAARSCARRIAAERGERPGGTIGYSVRLESRVSAATRLEIVTEGLLARRLLADPELHGVGLVIFDEFHERSLDCDLAFALALDTRRALRPDLRIMAMSATLDADDVAAHLGDAVRVQAQGRSFPVETIHLGAISVAAAVRRAAAETTGDILCFLPGEAEIRRAAEALRDPPVPDASVLPLYGALPPEEQDLVFRPPPPGGRKIVLATSIAETSLTIPGITCVVDCGLMRTSRFSPATGMSGLATLPLPLDRAEQRRGRAGRTAPGKCYRLWEEAEERFRPAKSPPEILDADLSGLVLASATAGALRRDGLPWPTPPPEAAWERATSLLRLLGALDNDGRLTKKGEAMARIPVHPRLAAMMLAGGGRRAALLAALVEEGVKSRETDAGRILDQIEETPRLPAHARIIELAKRFAAAATQAGTREGNRTGANRDAPGREGAILAAAYPDRIAANRGNGSFRMVSGRGAALDPSDPLAKSPFLVCCRLDDRPGDARIFLAAPISAEEIESEFASSIREERRCGWDRREERVRAESVRLLGSMELKATPLPPGDWQYAPETAAMLLEGVARKGAANLPCWTKESLRLRERLRFLHRLADAGRLQDAWPDPCDDAVISAMRDFVSGMVRWRDLERLNMRQVLLALAASAGCDARRLDALAPDRIRVPSGTQVAVDYSGEEPVLSVRLQECFGMAETPRVGGGAAPVVMELLSPARRPVQTTKDLAGFWRTGYALVRKDLRGRYPRHYWPEDPFSAVATSRVRPRTAAS